MDTQNPQQNNPIHIDIPQNNSFLSVEGQKKLFNYRMRFLWPFLVVSLLIMMYSFWSLYNAQNLAKEKHESSLKSSEITSQYNILSDKCRYIALSQYKDISSPEAQMVMAKCIQDDLNYIRSLDR